MRRKKNKAYKQDRNRQRGCNIDAVIAMTCKDCPVFEECKRWLNHQGPEPKCPDEDINYLKNSILDANDPNCEET